MPLDKTNLSPTSAASQQQIFIWSISTSFGNCTPSFISRLDRILRFDSLG